MRCVLRTTFSQRPTAVRACNGRGEEGCVAHQWGTGERRQQEAGRQAGNQQMPGRAHTYPPPA